MIHKRIGNRYRKRFYIRNTDEPYGIIEIMDIIHDRVSSSSYLIRTHFGHQDSKKKEKKRFVTCSLNDETRNGSLQEKN